LPEIKQTPVGGPVRILNSMVGQAKEYIDAEPDPEDKAAMYEILSTLEELVGIDVGQGQDVGQQDGQQVAKAHLFVRRVFAEELAGVQDGEIKAVWNTAYVNNLPDGAFLYVAPGGTKDSEGKTVPRSLRYFPVKDANGAVDMPHLRNALARIPQSNLSQAVKDSCTAKAQRMMNANKMVDAAEEPQARVADPLKEMADAVALEYASGGESLRKPPRTIKQAPAEPTVPLPELKARMREEMLTALSGGTITP
jgi:hypothetical protein